jgi:hypothetical protein
MVDFQHETTDVQLLEDSKAVSRIGDGVYPLSRVSAQAQGNLARRRVPDTPLALRPCPPGGGLTIASPKTSIKGS